MSARQWITLSKHLTNGKPKKPHVPVASNPVIPVKLKRSQAQWDKMLKRARKIAGQSPRYIIDPENQ